MEFISRKIFAGREICYESDICTLDLIYQDRLQIYNNISTAAPWAAQIKKEEWNMRKKRILSLALASVTALGLLSSCGGGSGGGLLSGVQEIGRAHV